ncbi:MAG: hypothetical protein D5R97_00215 [Candidatus Syntrophonatronum acetioxidans]|uniref:Spore cortex biosynthesis protein YabQ n=1 Tax=Candidatus Syntrophonatronum acetioxidans TaxID=1795816 RepID=A0A424YJ32_9FIRM|nr:MAG: hypothetical protein D5R97_00215 [Candidatus Syntrophonatronum acetioxidans]
MPLAVEFIILLSLIAMGFLLGIVFDFCYIFKSCWNIKKSWFNIVIDFLIWVLLTGVALAGLLLINWGQVRFYVFLAMAPGYLLYYSTIRGRYCHIITIIMQKMVQGVRYIKRKGKDLKRGGQRILSFLIKPFIKIKKKLEKNYQPKRRNF